MKFTCESCSAQYMISDEKVGPSGVKVRCKKCGNVIVVRRGAAPEAAREKAEAAAPAAPAPAAEAAPPGAAAEAPAPPGDAPAAAPAAAPAQPGFDAELGEAFDNVFREGAGSETPAAAPTSAAPQPDLASTQLMGSEDAAKVFADKPSGAAATEWYVAIGQAQVGPLPLAEVKRKWEGGDVGPDSLAWRPGMGDWAPVSSIPDLAGYLAPVPRPSGQPARAGEARPEPAGRVEPVAPAAAEPSWKPVGASALAALASEELASRNAPEPKPAARGAQSAKSLVDALPDGGGVDPTGALPLNIKALEAVTDERKLERRSSLAKGAEQTRQRRSTARAVAVGAVIGVVVVAGAAVGGVYLYKRYAQPPPRVAVAVPAPAPAPVTPPAPPATPPAAEAQPAAGQQAAAAPQIPPAKTEVPPVKEAVAEKSPPAATPEKEVAPPHEKRTKRGAKGKTARVEAPTHKEPPRKEPPRLASAQEPAQAAPPKRAKGSLLDFESNDKALDEALGSGSTGKSGRSVYVPPAAAAGTLPPKVPPGDINAAVAQRIDALRRCVSEQKSREPDASGTLKMRWIIQGDGSVSDVKCLTPQYAQGQFAQCIGGVVKNIKFPRSQTTGQEVTFPFNF